MTDLTRERPEYAAFHSYLDAVWPLWKQHVGTSKYYDWSQAYTAGWNAALRSPAVTEGCVVPRDEDEWWEYYYLKEGWTTNDHD